MDRKQPNKNTNQGDKDLLFDYFRDHLEDIELPVNEKCWDNISAQIIDKPNNGKRRILLFVSSVAAILLIALLSAVFFWKQENNSEPFLVKQEKTPINNIIQSPEVDEKNNLIIEEQDKRINDQKSDKQLLAQHKTSSPDIKKQNKENKNISTVRLNKEDNSNKFIESSTLTDKKNSDDAKFEQNEPSLLTENMDTQKNMDTQMQDSINLVRRKEEMQKLQDLYDGKHDNLFAQANLDNNKGKWGVSASFSSATSSSRAIHQTRPVNALSINEVFLATKKADSVTDIDYAPPFSVGLTVSKELNDRFSIETGVVYSYLSTKYKDQEKNAYYTRVKLHYLGIPVNVLVNIWDINPRFKVYASFGGMLEKGLKFDFTQDNILENQKLAENSKISGVQWSINASAGASYRFYDKWNIYLEPQISYFFNNNQPISIRTEKKTIFSINTGIRYQF